MSRALVFLVAVVAHVALIALLANERAIREETPTDESRMVLVFLTQDAIVEPAEPAAPSPRPRSLRHARPAADRASGSSGDSGAISEPLPPESAVPPSAPSTDWSHESELAAQRQVDAMEGARRRARGFTSLEADRKHATSSAPAPEFGWYRAHTQRIEPIPSGGTLIHLNERCVVAIVGAIIPMCAIGKIVTRGDLFEHMYDTPQLGAPQ
jgi:hypothetical protein